MTFHTVPNAKAYSKIAVDSAYARMAERLKSTGRVENAAKLRSLFIIE